MRVLLSTVGSRGDVQPMVALALHLRETGHDACLCAPPGFEELIRGLGLEDLDYFPIGHDLRLGPRKVEGGPPATVAAQFAVLREAAAGCDVIVGCAAMQIARSLDRRNSRYPLLLHRLRACSAAVGTITRRPLCTGRRGRRGSVPAPSGTSTPNGGTTSGATVSMPRARGPGLGPVTDVRAHMIYRSPAAGCRSDAGPMADSFGSGGDTDRVLAASRPAAARGRPEQVPRRRRSTDSVRIRQHARAVDSGSDDGRRGQDARTTRDHIAWLGGHHGARRFPGLA